MATEHSCKNCEKGCSTNTETGNHSLTYGCGKSKLKTMTIEVKNDKVDCNVLKVFECEDQEYIALRHKETERVYIYRYKEVNEDLVLEEITENEELRLVGGVLIELLEEL